MLENIPLKDPVLFRFARILHLWYVPVLQIMWSYLQISCGFYSSCGGELSDIYKSTTFCFSFLTFWLWLRNDHWITDSIRFVQSSGYQATRIHFEFLNKETMLSKEFIKYCRFGGESLHWTTSLWPFYRSHWQLLHVLWSFWCKRVGCPIWRYASPCNWFGVDVSLVMWPLVWSPWEICFLVRNRRMAWYQRYVLHSQIPGVSWGLQRYFNWCNRSLFYCGLL